MPKLSPAQQELLAMLQGIHTLDLRTSSTHAYLYDNYHFCTYDYPLRLSTAKAIIRSGKAHFSGYDTYTGWAIYKLN